jgi:hypothetical protein
MYHRAVQETSGRGVARGLWALAFVPFPFLLSASPALATDAEATRPALSVQQLADRAYELHAAGRYAEAIAAYLKVYDASNVGVALLNVATIYDRKLHERALATEYYTRYLNAPDAEPELVRRATERLAALKLEEEAQSRTAQADPIGSHAADPIGSHVLDPTTADSTHATQATTLHVNVVPALHTASPQAAHSTYAGGRPMFATPPASEAPDEGHGWQTTGFVLTATGIVGVGTGLIFGLLAKLKNDDANSVCNGSACPTTDGVNLAHQAGNLATASTVMFFSGLGLTGGGIVMIAWPKRSYGARPTHLALAPQFGPSGAGLVLAGGFRGL